MNDKNRKKMTIEQIKSNLCDYDKRNPDNFIAESEDEIKKDNCSCDNCFYGRTKLAEELIKRIELSLY